MDKFNRNIDEQRMNESKINTIDFVMNSVSAAKEKKSLLSFTKLRISSIEPKTFTFPVVSGANLIFHFLKPFCSTKISFLIFS